MPRVVASITARMTSSRLPGKVLKPCVGKPMLELMVERVRRARLVDEVVVATTTNPEDDAIEALARRMGVGVFRGDEQDVVSRVVGAMGAARAEVVVHLTGDCPLIDPALIDQLVRLFLWNRFDHVSNILVRSFPRGLDTQVTTLEVLRESHRIARDDAQREHVCLSIYENPDRFRLFNLVAPPECCRPDYRWTLDTEADYRFLSAVFEALYSANPAFSTADVIRLLESRPEIVALNADVPQKTVRG